MSLILRKCKSDGSSSHSFVYGQTGDTVEALDWKPTAQCGNGLHGLLEANGNWHLLKGDDWMVIEADEEDVFKIDKDKCKFKKGKIIYRGNKERLEQFIPRFKLNSHSAYWWAKTIGNRKEMINFIDNAEDAFNWALNIGNKEEMIKFIDNSKHAYYWAHYIGDKDQMIKLIDNSDDAFHWALNISDKDQMIELINSEEYAYYWARDIGNQKEMIEKFPGIKSRIDYFQKNNVIHFR